LLAKTERHLALFNSRVDVRKYDRYAEPDTLDRCLKPKIWRLDQCLLPEPKMTSGVHEEAAFRFHLPDENMKGGDGSCVTEGGGCDAQLRD
jgi:hypothetical protein